MKIEDAEATYGVQNSIPYLSKSAGKYLLVLIVAYNNTAKTMKTNKIRRPWGFKYKRTHFIYLQGSTLSYKKLSADEAALNGIKAAKSKAVIKNKTNNKKNKISVLPYRWKFGMAVQRTIYF